MKLLLALATISLAAAQQQPAISNANLRQVAATSGLEAAIRSATTGQSGPVWVGYAVQAIPGEHNACCWSNDSRGCGLEGQRSGGKTGRSHA